MARARSVADVLVMTYEEWRDDRCVRLGAGLAYYGLFALVPVLVLAVAMADLLFTTTEVQSMLAQPLARLLGEDAEQVAARLAEVFVASDLGTGFGLVGLTSTLIAASLVFVALQDALNEIWDIPYEAGLGH